MPFEKGHKSYIVAKYGEMPKYISEKISISLKGRKLSENHRHVLEEKIYSKRRGSSYEEMYGVSKAIEIKKKVAAKAKNRKHTVETKQKIAESKMGKDNPMYGKKPWNYGLTKDADRRVRAYNEKQSITKRGTIPWNKGKIGVSKNSLRSESDISKTVDGNACLFYLIDIIA